MGRSAGIIQVGPGYNHKCPDRMKARESFDCRRGESSVSLEAGIGVMWLRDTGSHKKLGKQETIFSLGPSEEAQPPDTLILDQRD